MNTLKIKSINRKETPEMTVDIEVENTHSYQLSNGAVSHNTISKMGGLTEGWHLPSMKFYLRWVQFKSDDPLVQQYREMGYPTRDLVQYQGMTIIGFPTCPQIADIMKENEMVCAGEASMEAQYKWLMLGEKYWIDGVDENNNMGNQISYTMKYLPAEVSYDDFRNTIRKYQPLIKCCSVMPQDELISYEYQPEQPVTKAKFEEIMNKIIVPAIEEDISIDELKCAGGACPVEVRSDEELKELAAVN